MVDRLTKYAHFFALSHPYTAKDMTELFISEVVELHGFPATIVSDRDQLFMSLFWKEMFRKVGTQLKMSTSYHPQTDGQTEVDNRCLEVYLRCLVGTKPKQWPKLLAWAEFRFNTNFNISAKMSPFKALYGQEPPLLIKGAEVPSKMEEVNRLSQDRDELLKELRENLLKAQDQMKKYADSHRRELTLQEGDWVFLKLQPYRMKSLAKKANEKLRPRFYEPYKVVQRIGEVAYKLELPDGSRIHPVFHVSLLKKAVKPTCIPQPLPAALDENYELQVQPEKVMQSRTTERGAREVLIKWQELELPHHENSWESATEIQSAFPEFDLEDKVNLEGGGIDRWGKVYSRRYPRKA